MSLAAETRAFEALTALLREIDACRALFDEARLDYPQPLKRLLGIASPSTEVSGTARPEQVPPPSDPARPQDVPPTYIWVPIEGLTIQTLVLGILRTAGHQMGVKAILAEAQRYRAKVSDGSVANVGTRLESQSVITRSPLLGWDLINPEQNAPLLRGAYAWGPVEVFQPQELAARRREAIRYILSRFPSGLQQMQVLEQLESCNWLATPLTKDLVKADLEVMGADGLRRSSNKKWVLKQEE